MIPSYIPREANKRCGRMKYSLCFPYVQYSSTLIVQLCFLYWLSCFFFPMASLQGSILYLMCVFLKEKSWLHLCIVGAFVRFSWLDLSVCRHFRWGFFLLCSWSGRPTGNTAFFSGGSPYIIGRILLSFFTQTINKSARTIGNIQTTVGVLKKLCILYPIFHFFKLILLWLVECLFLFITYIQVFLFSLPPVKF